MTYRLTDDQRRHVTEVVAQINNLDQQVLHYEGLIRRNERELSFMRRHLQLYVGSLAMAAGIASYALSQDLTELVSRDQGTPAAAANGDNSNGMAT